MPAARGDQKPCAVADCTGTVQYGRRVENEARAPGRPARPGAAQALDPDARGWVCSADAAHFHEE